MISFAHLSKKIIPQIFLVTLVSGCAVPNPSFEDMAAQYQDTVEQYNFNNILLNVVRASEGLPLSFLDIPTIIGTGSFTAGTGGSTYTNGSLSGSWLSGVTSTFSINPNVTVGKSFNYTQSSLDNATFQQAFNTSIPLTTVNFFASSNMSAELLGNLLIDTIELQEKDGKIVTYNNSPSSPTYNNFLALLKTLQQYNLRTYVVNTEIPFGPKMTDGQAVTTLPVLFQQAKQSILQMKYFPAEGKEKPYYQYVQNMQMVKLCFGESAFADEIKKKYGDTYFCIKQNPKDPKILAYEGVSTNTDNNTLQGKSRLRINIRSNKDIYQYLGEIMRIQNQNPQFQVLANPRFLNPDSKEPPRPLFVVLKNQNVDKFIAKVNYRGDTYVVPYLYNGYSTLVINMLSQLLNLNKVNGSIPQSPAVIVK